MLHKAEEKLNQFSSEENEQAHPRLVAEILNRSSWEANEEIQDMWAGLLASACTSDGRDESNIIFVNILAQLTSLQAKILNYGCENAKKSIATAGWICTEGELILTLGVLRTISGCNDFHRLDRELDQLRNLGLIGQSGISGGFAPESTNADITPSGLALQMYVRCKGYIGDPIQFFHLASSSNTENTLK